ncbi:MAG: polysaccharide deacetylase family protein [Hydrogenophaga sp.]|nr:polysaccharide deacetylase family protein [Hydrogenophaga sp.]
MKGDNPVSNSPAGLRVWLERVPNQLPLRLIGKNEAAYIMSWSRTLGAKKPAGLIAFDERRISKYITSRTVTLGFPEQNWLRSDTRQLSAITRGALSWLFREPHAYVGAWPSPYQNAILFAIQAAEPVRQAEVDIGNAYRKLGGVATYYVLGSNIDKAVPFVEKIAAQGHEIGFYGDIFESFDKQPESQQLERLETMKKQVLKSGLKIQEPFSFSTPMNGYDSTTRRLLEEKGFGNYLSFMELTESALPFVASRNSDGSPRTTVLPRTLTSPEEVIMEFGAEDGMTSYLDSLDMSTKMGGISVVSIPSENLIPPEELRRLFDKFSKLNDQSWFSSARQISHWWSQREGISVLLEPHPQGYSLSTTVTKAISSSNSIGIWINLPRLDSRIQILGLTDTDKSPAVLVKDGFRVVMNLSVPAVGQKKWLIKFD